MSFAFGVGLIGTDNKAYVTGSNKGNAKYKVASVAEDPTKYATTTVTFTEDDMKNGTYENNTYTYTQKVSLSLSGFKKVGKYYYLISEQTRNDGISYDDPKILEITVTNDTTNTESDTLYYTYALYNEDDIDKSRENTNYKVSDFKNEYPVGKLDVTKKVTGNMSDKARGFSIAVILSSSGDISTSKATYKVGDGQSTEITFTYDKDSNESTATITPTLQHGQKLEIVGIPDGVSWTVKEVALDDYLQTYTSTNTNVTLTSEANANGTLDDKKTSVVSDGYSGSASGTFNFGNTDAKAFAVAIENYKNSDIDTGVVLESLPYVIILAIVAVGAIMFLARKRKHSED